MHPTAGDPGLLAGRYRLGALLGRGGMAEVYDAFDERLARPVAVKILRPSSADDAGVQARFDREARSVAQLSHPAVVAVYDSGEDGGRSYLVMERLPGETLADRMRAGPVDPAWLVPVASDVLGALAAAHTLGLVHRDIKPANILLAADGRAKVADFGIAKSYRDDLDLGDPDGADLTATGLILGTVAYLSPEQIGGAPASPQADIYALGVVLYEALAGRKPYVGDNPIAQARAAIESAAPDLTAASPGTDARLAAVVRRAMARRVEDRYPSAVAMLADLTATGLAGDRAPSSAGGTETAILPAVDVAAAEAVAPTFPVGAARPAPPVDPPRGPPPPPDRAGDDRRRARLIAAIVILAVVVVVVAIVAVAVNHSSSPRTVGSTTTTATISASTTSVVVPSTTGATTTPAATAAPTTTSTMPPSTTSSTAASTTTSTAAPSTTSTSTTTSTTTTVPETTTSAGGD